MAVPRFLLPQGQGCDTQPATVELIPAWCLEILPQHWIPSWNVGFKGLWNAADKLKLGSFFFFSVWGIKNFASLQLFFLHRSTQQTETHSLFPKEEGGRPSREVRMLCACSHFSEKAVCSHPFATLSSFQRLTTSFSSSSSLEERFSSLFFSG